MEELTEGLRYVTVGDVAQEIEDWRYVHNEVIPFDPLSAEQVGERATRYRLEVLYLGGQAVGCSTERPPTEEDPVVTVIVRILPEHRRRGLGTALYRRALDRARELSAVGGATEAGVGIVTVVLASDESGMRFAERMGFIEIERRGLVEIERYLLDRDNVPCLVLLRLEEPDRALTTVPPRKPHVSRTL
ncbi:GNAT family N-acetyltransferase [Streptacidiphilus anmyonensis]|uniref:GNAT family N-acetyltransferase n=1 Tax=Streptacidiphilus anmyonensis TaxID=405782 RepID=UPI0005A9E7EE|nr:GNAT family N-acetyltransferase [Streptacidiphilus anmyonensis]